MIALTATATPLRAATTSSSSSAFDEGAPLIHGFRRTNIAVEVVEMTPSRPAIHGDAFERLAERSATRRPAIVYAPTRKKAEEPWPLAHRLSGCPAAVYHAGLAADRGAIASRRLSWPASLEVIVATIAFGMGIDKADVRTVVHTALPASVEGYYQEIGRAGRDGAPSRAILLHSYADRRTHEWFLERDYPDPQDLERVHRALDATPRSPGAIAERIAARRRMSADRLEKALEKLWIHGGARVSPEGDACRGPAEDWRGAYLAQRAHKQAQLAEIARYAESVECRMLRLVRHFGDQADAGHACGHCDVCAPEETLALRFREVSAGEHQALLAMLAQLRARDGQATGKLFAAVAETSAEPLSRDAFEALLAALVRSGLVRIEDAAFERDGERIAYRRVFATPAARADGETLAALRVTEPTRRSSRTGGGGATRSTRRRRSARSGSGSRRRTSAAKSGSGTGDPRLIEALKAWRLAEARRRRVPAFKILNDRTLAALAEAMPRDEAALLAVRGIGPTLARKHGADLLALVARHRERAQ